MPNGSGFKENGKREIRDEYRYLFQEVLLPREGYKRAEMTLGSSSEMH